MKRFTLILIAVFFFAVLPIMPGTATASQHTTGESQALWVGLGVAAGLGLLAWLAYSSGPDHDFVDDQQNQANLEEVLDKVETFEEVGPKSYGAAANQQDRVTVGVTVFEW